MQADFLIIPAPGSLPGDGLPVASNGMRIALNGPAGGLIGLIVEAGRPSNDVSNSVTSGAILEFGANVWRYIYQATQINEAISLTGGASAYWDGSQFQQSPATGAAIGLPTPSDQGDIGTVGAIQFDSAVGLYHVAPTTAGHEIEITGDRISIVVNNGTRSARFKGGERIRSGKWAMVRRADGTGNVEVLQA